MSDRPLHVLQFICPTGFYGAERWILALAKHLAPDRVRSSLAVTLEPGTKDLELVRQFRDQGLGDTHALPMRHRFDLGVVRRLARLIESEGVDLIHTHGYKSDIIGLLAARRAKVPCLVTPHGFENASDPKLRAFIWLGCKAMARADAVAPLSPALMDDCRRLGVPNDRLHYIQNGVDLTEVEEERLRPIKKSGKRRIGFIGQLISRKNVDDILTIFDRLHGDRDDIELQLLGDGDDRPRLEALADQLSSRPDIHFLGFRDDRLELLHSFDLFVMTSTLEGIPRCLMEACAMGVPVAAYDIPGVDQLIRHGETGLLAAPGDQAGLESHWRSLLDDRELAGRLGGAAREHVREHYSAERMTKEYEALYRQLRA